MIKSPFLRKGFFSTSTGFESELKALRNQLIQQFHRLKTDFAVKQYDR